MHDRYEYITIRNWLIDRDMYSTAMKFEEECTISLNEYHGKLRVVRELCYKGNFHDLTVLCESIFPTDTQVMRAIILQDMKERIWNIATKQDISGVVHALVGLRDTIPESTFSNLLSACSDGAPRTHPVFDNWSPDRGRYLLFQSLLEKLSPLFPSSPPSTADNYLLTQEEPQSEVLVDMPLHANQSTAAAREPHVNLHERAEYADGSCDPIRAVEFNHKGTLVSVGTNSQSLLLCNSADLSIVARRDRVHGGSLYTCAWSPDDRYIATGSNDQMIQITSVNSLMNDTPSSSGSSRIQPQLGTVRCLEFMPSGDSLLAGFSQDGIARIIDVSTGVVSSRLECSEQGYVTSVHLSGPLIAVGNSTGRACVFDQRLQKPIVWDHQFKSKECVVVSMNDSHVGTGTQGGTLALWDIRSSPPIWTKENYHKDSIRAVSFSKNGRYLASASFDKTVRVCDTSAIDEVQVLRGHRNRVVGLAWSETGPLVSCGCDSRVILWS